MKPDTKIFCRRGFPALHLGCPFDKTVWAWTLIYGVASVFTALIETVKINLLRPLRPSVYCFGLFRHGKTLYLFRKDGSWIIVIFSESIDQRVLTVDDVG